MLDGVFIHGQNERPKTTALVMCMRVDYFTFFPLDSASSQDRDAGTESLRCLAVCGGGLKQLLLPKVQIC